MFELIIMLSRFIFIFLIAYFLILGMLYIADERNIMGYNSKSVIYHQRFVIVATHILAFIILSYNNYHYDIATIVMGGAFLVVFIYSLIVIKIFYNNSCPLIWNGVFYLLDIGFIMLTRLSPSEACKQIIWIFIGINLAMLGPFIFKFFKKLNKLKYLYLVLLWVFILLPSFYGVSMYGAQNWVNINGITFQPSEPAKIFFMFYLASVFYEKPEITQMVFPSLMAGSIVIMLVKQNDLGAALIFFMTYLVIVYITTGNPFYFLSGLTFAALAAFFVSMHYPHIQRRIEAWSNPWADIDDAGYQIAQSLFAIGTWGLIGSGLTRGYPHKIPVVYSDFIFSAICEEFGVLFGLMLIGVLLMVLFRGAITSLRSSNVFYCVIAASVTSILAFQSFLIIGGVIKLIPLTGVTLPFLSYGGSSIVICLIMIGILAELSKVNYNRKVERIYEMGDAYAE